MDDIIVTSLKFKNPPRIPALLYSDVIGPHVKLADDLKLPLDRSIPRGDPIANILLEPFEKYHRVAYRAILRDAVARRIKLLGGHVEKKNVFLCGYKFLFDVTLSNDKRILTLFPQGDVDPIGALALTKRFKDRIQYVEIGRRRVFLEGPVMLRELRGGKFPKPQIVLLDESENIAYTDDPVKPFMEGRGRAFEGGVDLGLEAKIHVVSDDRRILHKLSEFAEMFFYGYEKRLGYEKLMRTKSRIIEEETISSIGELDAKPREIYFVALSKESEDAYRIARRIVLEKKSLIHMFKLESLEEFYESLKRGKYCGPAALAVDIHLKLGMMPYKLAVEKIFGDRLSRLPEIYGITQISGFIAGAKYTADGRFLESFVEEDLEGVLKRVEEGDIVYSQGVRSFRRNDGAVLYVDRKTTVGLIEGLKPARGAYFFTPRDGYVTTGFNCRALRVRIIRPYNYKAYTLTLYTYRSSRLLQRDFPVLVPPVIRAIDRMREHIQKGIYEKHSVRPRFL